MHLTKTSLMVAGIFHSATATFGYGGWGGDSHYSTPDNTDNKCSSEQTKGYNWDGLASGSFDNYGSNTFSKWSCTNSFGKRDLLTKRTFQSKCISSNLDDEPSIGCDGEDHMSIDKYEVSSNEDAEIECHYEMPDKTVCKECHSCKSSGTVIQNTQCGGAKSVTFKPAESFKGKGCNIGVHSIGFNCGTASSTAPAASKTESIPAYDSSTPPTYATSSSETESSTEAAPTSSEVQITTDATPYTSPTSVVSATSSSTTSTDSIPSYDTTLSTTSETASETLPIATDTQSVPTYDTSTSTCVEGYGASCSTTSESVSSSATSSETSPVETSAPQYSESSTSSAVSNSESSAVTGTTTSPAPSSYSSLSTGTGGTIPSYNTSLTYKIPAYTSSSSTTVDATSIGSYSSYSTSTIYSTTCETLTSSGSITTLTKSYAVSTTIAAVTSPGKESSPAESSPAEYTPPSATSYSGPEPSSPALLPRCLNTWMYLTDCSSNSDSTCYCKHSDFINKVYGCLSAWSQSSDNATNGVSYLMGLCAPYVSENPAIITGCPSTITPAAYTPPTTTSITSTITPTSTITLQSTITSTATLPASSSNTEVSPITTSPAPTPPANVPCTTITYSQDITLPATYPSGTSQGSIIPSSSITSAIVTTITVPQVQITTFTITESGSTIRAPGLGYGVPSSTISSTSERTTTPTAAPSITSQSIPVYGSVGFTKSPSSSAGYAASSGIVPYEGVGVRKFAGTTFWIGGFGVVFGMVVL